MRAQLDGLEARLADEETRGIARAARRAGGRRLDEDLDIDPALRAATEAALAEATRAYVVGADAVPTLATERGSLVIAERAKGSGPEDARDRRYREAIAAAGGGTLDDAVRRDTTGVARRLLVRAAWLPDLDACLAMQASMPPGWIVVTRDGGAIVTDVGVTFGAAESVLERRAEAARLAGEVESLEAEVGNLRAVAVRMAAAARATADAVEAARAEESRTESARRAAEEAERRVARRLETVVREASWHEAQAVRLAAELDRARAAVAMFDVESQEATAGTDTPEALGSETGTAVMAWEARAVELRSRRDRLAEEAGVRDASRRDAENRRVRAEASTALAEQRMARADADLATLGERERSLAEERDALRAEIASTTAREAAAREALAEIHAADAADRDRLGRAEREAAAARERLRSADARLRGTDHVELEARLGLDAIHEAVVVELAGLGEFGIAGLEAAAGVRPGSARIVALDTPAAEARVGDIASEDDETVSDEAAALEAALALVTPIWAAGPPASPAPSPARLGQLRRRFHELGAVNPFAVDEYDGPPDAPRDARDAGVRPVERHQPDTRPDRRARHDDRRPLPDDIRRPRNGILDALRAAVRRWLRQAVDDRPVGPRIDRDRDRRPTAGQEGAGAGDAVGRGARSDGGRPAVRDARGPACAVLRPRRGRRRARRGQHRALRGSAPRASPTRPSSSSSPTTAGTIEAADALYGVTVGDDSVSRVISLRLDEAQALAARDRGDLAAAG